MLGRPFWSYFTHPDEKEECEEAVWIDSTMFQAIWGYNKIGIFFCPDSISIYEPREACIYLCISFGYSIIKFRVLSTIIHEFWWFEFYLEEIVLSYMIAGSQNDEQQCNAVVLTGTCACLRWRVSSIIGEEYS